MPPRFCCCAENCLIFEDGFNRADAATLGASWNDPSSAFGIDTNRAFKGSGSALALLNIAKATPPMLVTYEINITDPPDGYEYWLIVNALDADNYHIARFFNTSTPSIEIGVVVGGTYTLLATENILGPPTLGNQIFAAAIATNEFCATLTGTVVSRVTTKPSLIAGGTKSGMGGISTGNQFFDNFEFSHHAESLADCGVCLCRCDGAYFGPKLFATFEASGRMLPANGQVMELNYDRVNGNWSGSKTICGSTWRLLFVCDGSDPSLGRLTVVFGCKDSDFDTSLPGYVSAGVRVPVGVQCSPLLIEYGPFFVGSSDLTCTCGSPFTGSGIYVITITH